MCRLFEIQDVRAQLVVRAHLDLPTSLVVLQFCQSQCECVTGRLVRLATRYVVGTCHAYRTDLSVKVINRPQPRDSHKTLSVILMIDHNNVCSIIRMLVDYLIVTVILGKIRSESRFISFGPRPKKIYIFYFIVVSSGRDDFSLTCCVVLCYTTDEQSQPGWRREENEKKCSSVGFFSLYHICQLQSICQHNIHYFK